MSTEGSKITLSMVVCNESARYLRRVLASHREYIDEAVIIDDGSTDDTVEVCRELLEGIPLHLVSNPHSTFHNEVELRKQQWRETVARQPDWILNMDADECFESARRPELKQIARQHHGDVVCFRLYDMWSETHYRDDDFWCAHKVFRPFLFRYKPKAEYVWHETPQHCGRFPRNVMQFPIWYHPIRVQHFGWARADDREHKYKRYMRLDGEGKYGWKEQYESILDPSPKLLRWEES